ncbi:hypothetical protein AA0311_2576 [Asaia bogorensis NBRC 16594]|uniref:Uncharacterized protein n=1 Tax=Asaia bogorensis NBRC 16594 TaxID=1231624 RepID=A0AAN4U3R2_9PROT|nr:hypothetical protein AA0311_2576 [Asaia bogorensis NBRC 16594]GEL54914.1 hypothetical protein ABO01nite_29210 [Asaia bogorensis NBRC 16594]
MTKRDLPPISADLAPTPRPKLNLGGLRAPRGAEDHEIAQNSRQLGSKWGAQTSLEEAEPTAMSSLRLVIPEYVDRQLATTAVTTGVTKQYLVLKALSDAGFEVAPNDLVEDRRKSRTRFR